MKTILTLVAGVCVGVSAALVFLPRKPPTVIPVATAAGDTAWQEKVARLEAALRSARARPQTVEPVPTPVAVVAAKISPREIIEKLKGLKAGSGQTRGARQIIAQFESLMEAGPEALPAIREFLARNEEIDYESSLSGFSKGAPRDGKISTEFLLPPSLRLGLFEALKNIGGTDAEKILADTLATTGRGVEVAWLARALQEMAPDKYRDVALTAAREMLAHPLAASSASALDKNDRNYLFGVLAMFGDASFASQAQAQLIQPDGKLDAAALKYLQQTQPDKVLAIAIQAYQDPRITDVQAKERLAQVALDSAGIDPQADRFFAAVLGDTSLPADNRRNLAEDFADHGTNPKNPSAQDFQVMQKRLAQLDILRAEATDPRVIAGIAEAQKDLKKFIVNYVAKHPTP